MEHISSRSHRYQYQHDCPSQNWPKVHPEISPGREHGRGIEQRRKKQIKDELRFELNRGKTGNQSEEHATTGEQDRIRDPNFSSNERQQSDGDQTNQDQFGLAYYDCHRERASPELDRASRNQ